MEEKKLKRRTSKTRFTRQKRALESLLEEGSLEELTSEFDKLELALGELQERHDEYCETIVDSAAYDKEEEYIQGCIDEYAAVKTRFKSVIKGLSQPQMPVLPLLPEQSNQNPPASTDRASPLPLTPTSEQRKELKETCNEQHVSSKLRPRVEKPKLPVFAGDVRDYHTFKDDFQHMVDPMYDARDAVSILRGSLSGKPLELLKGIGTDYHACWEYLDMYYGDPRVVSDAVTQDLIKFRGMQHGEDGRFCELAHLVRRCYNILKQVGKEADMNNNHMLAIIEKKLTLDDRKVYARSLQKNGQEASLEGLLSFFNEEMKARMRATASIRSSSICQQNKVNLTQRQTGNLSTSQPHQRWKKCWVCESDDHWPDQCARFKELAVTERYQIVKEKHACFSCLKRAGKEHNMRTCRRKTRCSEGNCESFHHVLLHKTTGGNIVGFASNNNEVALPIISTRMGTSVNYTTGNVLLDSGANVTLIRVKVAEQLGLEGKPISVDLDILGGDVQAYQTKVYRLKMYSANQREYTISAVGVPEISNVPRVSTVILRNMESVLGQTLCRGYGAVDVLLGVDYPEMHGGETKQVDGYLLRKSPLGWVMFGSSGDPGQSTTVLHVNVTDRTDLTQFWSTEEMGVKLLNCKCKPSDDMKMSPGEREQFNDMWDSCKKVNGRWLVPYPWKKDPKELPNNKKQCMAKLVSIELRLKKNENNAKLYDDQMKEMEQNKFARKLSDEEIKNYEGPVHYISHHPVIRPEKKSTPVRIVFNSSAAFNGHRLNEYWEKGPDLLNDLFGVLLRFRQHPIAISGDISKMYHQVRIPETDMHVHRFLWRSYESREPDVYVKEVVTFGDKPAPAMALTALRRTAADGASQYPEAANILTKDTYMDDICTSVHTIEEARKVTSDMDAVLDTGGFKTKGWFSNGLLKDDEKTQGEQFVIGDSEEQKVLGVVWDPELDILKYKVKPVATKEKDLMTKRMVLSELAKIFDPIGFTGALLIKGKILMQKLWQTGTGWDEPLSTDDKSDWRRFFTELERLDGVSFERCLMQEPMKPTEIIIFCDASEDAFGAVAYTRWEEDDGNHGVRFISAKSRVAPLKYLSIPRLELQAAVVASRLYATIKEEMSVQFERVIFLSDSIIALSWIRGQSRQYKSFVANRVAEIQSQTDPSDWRHIPGEYNVADKVSRGVSVKDLKGAWKDGPAFLRLPEEEWPKCIPKADVIEIDKEKKKESTVLLTRGVEGAIDCKKFSSWRNLIRVTAYVFRFLTNLKAKCLEKDGPLSVEELSMAENYWIRETQKKLRDDMEKGTFKSLSPFVKDDIIYVGGRVGNGLFSYDMRHPALLPRDDHISYLITRNVHERGHYGVATTAAKIRNRYWIVGVTSLAKKVKFRCVNCRAFNHKAETQLMANLPVERLAPFTPPFHFTACDYFGPIVVKVGRNKTTKHYGVIFTCLNTRAVHLEVAVDCSTMEFLQVLRRFFAIRGHPKLIQSDNGTQFVGAQRQLREMVKGWEKDELKEFCAERQVTWKFMTPLAPHQNGCAESLVKSCKHALKKAIGEQRLTPFELHTYLQEVANLVNERPIGRLPNDPDDGTYICPNDILLGRASSRVPQGPFRPSKNPKERVEFVQRIVDAFWKSWIRDVFPLLVPRRKWNTDRRNVRVDDVVLIADPNLVRGQWKLGRITEVYPGKDNRVRNVQVKTANGLLSRPVTKIVVICPVEGFE